VSDALAASIAQSERQVAHWVLAAARLNLDDLAGPDAWNHLERYLGLSLRTHLGKVVERLSDEGKVLTALSRVARSRTALAELDRKLLAFRRQFVRTETTLDFFADAINTRTSPRIGGLLRACDTLAYRSMAQVLDPLGFATPSTLTFLDQGLGAAILKQGLRLWDGGDVNPVAAIKVVRHNLLRPTALVHEAGHQVAHITGWNAELAQSLTQGLSAAGELAGIWASWATEIAADAVAFVTTGFASVAALHDVVAGDANQVFRFTPGDPHPVSYLRVLLGVEMCRRFYGPGPWDELELGWTTRYPRALLASEMRPLIEGSLPLLPAVVELTLARPATAFGGRSLSALVPPGRVSPKALAELRERLGPSLFASSHWLWTEPLRILALTGLMAAERPHELAQITGLQEQAMLRLGGALAAA
jgi:hypothetical protein